MEMMPWKKGVTEGKETSEAVPDGKGNINYLVHAHGC
jgi:hypothetical protein